MAMSTLESFFEILQRSALLTSEKMGEARELAREADDPESLAKTLVRQESLTRWQAGQLLAGRHSFFLGKYRLLDLLGRGGMGSVFVAEHTTMKRQVALKIISKQLGRDPASIEQFITEARSIAALDHPNIVQAYDIDNEGGRYYIVMEYVEGRDLGRIVDSDGPLDCRAATDFIRQAAAGLDHAHSRDMIHCDVKPANLLVNSQAVVKILDMGMARLIGSDRNVSGGQGERVLGTVDYLAPEQALDSSRMDHRADVYSLGCTLYYLLSGHPPFPGGTLHERILKHQTQEPPDIRDKRRDVPQDLADVCRRMMAKDPADRCQTAGEVAELLADPIARCDAQLEAAVDPGFPQVVDREPEVIVLPASPATLAGRISDLFAAGTGALRNRPGLAAVCGLAGVALVAVFMVVFLQPEGGNVQETAKDNPSTGTRVSASQSPEQADTTPAKLPDGDEWPEIAKPSVAFDPGEFDGPPSKDKTPEVKEPPKRSGRKKADSTRSDDEIGPKSDKKPVAPTGSKAQDAGKKPAKSTPDVGKPMGKNPFADLAKIVDIPELRGGIDSTNQVFLGKINSAPGVDWRLALHGGADALKSSRHMTRKFVLKRTEPAVAKARWIVRLDESGAEGATKSTEVAEIWRAGGALMFRWSADAEPASANYLRNCLLEILVSGQGAYLTLVSPRKADPVPVDLSRGTSTTGTSLDWLPETGKLRVDVTGLDGFDDYRVDPAEPAAPGTLVGLFVDRTDSHGDVHPGVEFRVVFSLRASTFSAMVQLLDPSAGQFRSLRTQNLAMVRESLVRQQEEVLKKLNPRDKTRAPKGAASSQLNGQLSLLEKQLWYVDFWEKARHGARVHFLLHTKVDGRKLTLASTDRK